MCRKLHCIFDTITKKRKRLFRPRKFFWFKIQFTIPIQKLANMSIFYFTEDTMHSLSSPIEIYALLSSEVQLFTCSCLFTFQICLPIKDGKLYKCLCKSGYELSTSSGLHKCHLASRDQFLLYGQQKPGVVRGLDITQPKNEVMLPMIDLSRPTAMDYHAQENHIYLADSNRLRIERHDMKSGQKSTFINSR